jgi:HPt (histidine-containing phosphotransfer) domain-containing protein
MDDEFDQLRKEFLAEAVAKADEIESILRNGSLTERTAVDRMIYLAHQLKGAGGSYGFDEISHEAAALESSLELAGANDGRPDADLTTRARNLKSEIEQRLHDLEVRAG